MADPSLAIVADLLRKQDIAALGSLRDGAPYVSLVPFVASGEFSALVVHLSGLAQHTRNLRSDERVSMLIVEPRPPGTDGQNLARLSLQGRATEIPRDCPAAQDVRRVYLDRFPAAARNFDLADFALFSVTPMDARLVAGFGRIRELTPAHLQAAARVAGASA